MQRRECQEFISRRDDWVFVGERMEKGISGYKVSAAKRDAIIEIREMAEKKQFDVLLVFMFDNGLSNMGLKSGARGRVSSELRTGQIS